MRIGNLQGEPWLIVDEAAGIPICEATGGRFGASMPELYDAWPDFMEWAATTTAPLNPFDPSDLLAPSPQPRQVFAAGLNYVDHAAEAGLAIPAEPAVFTKYVSSFAGPQCEVELPTETVDWEVELVVVLGRTAHRVDAADAWSYVAGLTVGQDISERRLQSVGNPAQFSLAKSFPAFSPTGPFLVTPDSLEDPSNLEIGCLLNGEQVQKARTSQLAFAVDVLIQKLSAVATLYPGDVIFTGTPAGVGAARKPSRYIKPGDELVSYVEEIGQIRQVFVAADREGSKN